MASTKDMIWIPGVASRVVLFLRWRQGKRIGGRRSICVVVPAKAGTQTPRPLDSAKGVGRLVSLDGTTRYGSRRSPGRQLTAARGPLLTLPWRGRVGSHEAKRNARRGGVTVSQLGYCSRRETFTPPRRSFQSLSNRGHR